MMYGLTLLTFLVGAGPFEPINFELGQLRDEEGCPKASGREIIVCGRKGVMDRYRIPPLALPREPSNVLSVMRKKQQIFDGTMSGTGSCSAVGPGGWTGCMVQGWKRSREQSGGGGFRF